MIIYDLSVTQPHGNDIKYHGAGKYAEIVYRRMIKRGLSFCAYYNSSKYINPELLSIAQLHNVLIYDISNVSLVEMCRSVDSPLIFSLIPHPGHLVCRTVGTIHDVRSVFSPNDKYVFKYNYSKRDVKIFFAKKYFPKYYKKRRIEQLMSLWKNDNFYPATITNFTKFTIYNLLSDDKILKMPVFYTPTDMGTNAGIIRDNKFILMVSGNRWIKNCLRGIISLDNIFTNGLLPSHNVVVTGVANPKCFKYKIKNINRFIFKDYVEEEELAALYSSCSCLLFPSLYEGFGMPPIEAMKYGKPVLSSCLSSMPEVCSSAAIYFDPFSIDDISGKILSLLCDDKKYKEMSLLSQTRYEYISKIQKEGIDGLIDYVLGFD